MRTPLRNFLLSCLAFVVATIPAHAVSCKVETQRDRTPADKSFIEHNYPDAEKLYVQELASNPSSEEALVGHTISLLYEDKLTDALDAAHKAVQQKPNDATLMAVLGQVQFRSANLQEAGGAFQKALALDPCSARAHFAIVRYLRTNSMYASAQKQLEVAHQLAPDDPSISGAWRASRPLPDQIAEMKEYVGRKDISEESRKPASEYLAYLEKRFEVSQSGGCHVVSSVKDTTQTMVPLGGGNAELWAQALGLDVRINEKTSARLLFDTGASGIYISHAIAEHAGLKPFARNATGGFGDQKDPTGYMAVVDDLRIGKLEFKNCIVEVSDSGSVVTHEGLIGGDVFQSFLIDVNFPKKTIRFSQLPPRPGEAAAPERLATEEADQEGSGSALHDRYIAPEMKGWVRVLRINHDLLVPTTVRDNQQHLFILDTGAYSNIVDIGVAAGVTKVSGSDTIIEGVSGKVADVRRGNTVMVQFGNMKARLDDAILVSTSKFSRADQIEIGGFVGFDALQFIDLQIDYRDNLVHFSYDRMLGFDQH